MYILAIETTGPHCSAAVIDSDGKVIEETSSDTLNHLQTLTTMLGEVMAKAGIELKDVDAIAVSEGPGSFTGIRIGVSTARGISQVLGTKLISVPTLQAFGMNEWAELGEKDVIVCPMLDARRHQVYAAGCTGDEEAVTAGPYMLDEFLGLLEGYDKIFFVGDGVKVYGDAIKAWGEENGKDVRMDEKCQRASGVARLGRALYDRGEFKTYNELTPNYMRKAEAERKLDAKKAAEKKAEAGKEAKE
jgi:tRNA threonylcarbamoyladenosine biosynthesis protein TsaB